MFGRRQLQLGACLGVLLASAGCHRVQSSGPAPSDPTAAGEVFASHDGTRIYYERVGSGRPVLLVHGFIVDGASWKETAVYRDLLNAGFKVIVPDLRGNGKSEKPQRLEAYQQDAEANDLVALVDELGLSSYCVVGYSRGAIIASRLLVLDPRARCAVLGGMGADFTDPAWARRDVFYEALSGKPVPELEGMVRYVEEKGLDRRALALMQKAQPSTTSEEFARVKKPVLVIAGDEDQENGSLQELARLIPGARHIEVPGDHGGTSRTSRFAGAVLQFLREH